MRKFVSLLIGLIIGSTVSLYSTSMADTHIYRGRYTNTSDILYRFDGKYMDRDLYTNTSDILLTADGIIPIPVMLMVII